MLCDTCGKPCGDGSVPVINDALFIVGYQCRHCVTSPPALCMHWDCTEVATTEYQGRGYCQDHERKERVTHAAYRTRYLRGGFG